MDQRPLLAGLFIILLLIGSWVGLGIFQLSTIQGGLADAGAELRSLQWAVTGTSYTVEGFSHTVNITYAENNTPSSLDGVVFNATVLDDTVTAYDPASIQLGLYTTGQRPISVWSGIFWPFNRIIAESNSTSILLWSEVYEDELGDIPGYTFRMVPAVGMTDHLNPGTSVLRNYTIQSGAPDIEAGQYTADGDFEVTPGDPSINVTAPRDRPLLLNGTTRMFEYELSFRLE